MKCTTSVALLIAIILPLIALLAFLMIPVDIQAATNTTVIEINISEVSKIEVTPTELSWTLLTPGTNGSIQNITVKNTGSTIFSNGIYLSVDTWKNTTNNPTAGDDPTKYMAGTFLTAGNLTHVASDRWWFINQISFNETTEPSAAGYSGWSTSATSWGYYQNNSQDWLWEMTAGGDGDCRNMSESGSFKIVQTADSKDLGTTHSANWASNNTEWGLWSFATGALTEHCVVTHTSCNFIMIYKFDRNTTISSCNNDTYVHPGTLNCGNSKTIFLKPNIPNGVPAGFLTNSTLTITAE